MVIQRANPGLYDMLTNGVLQANVAFDKAQLNCQNMAKRMMDFSDRSKWTQAAMMEEYKRLLIPVTVMPLKVMTPDAVQRGKRGRNGLVVSSVAV